MPSYPTTDPVTQSIRQHDGATLARLVKAGKAHGRQGLDHPLLALVRHSEGGANPIELLAHYLRHGVTPGWLPERSGEDVGAALGNTVLTGPVDLQDIVQNPKRFVTDKAKRTPFERQAVFNGGLRMWFDSSTRPWRTQVIDLLDQAGFGPVYLPHYSPVHAALERGDLNAATTAFSKRPDGLVFDAESLAYSGFWGLGKQEQAITKRRVNSLMALLELACPQDILKATGPALCTRLPNGYDTDALEALRLSPLFDWGQSPEALGTLWEHARDYDVELMLVLARDPAFLAVSQTPGFERVRRTHSPYLMPVWQDLFRTFLTRRHNHGWSGDEALVGMALESLESAGHGPWIGHAPEDEIPDPAFAKNLRMTVPDSWLGNRHPDFFSNGGLHPGFSAHSAEEVWVYKDDPDAWRATNAEGESVFASWMSKAWRDKRLTHWIGLLGKSKNKKRQPPGDGHWGGLTTLEWAARLPDVSTLYWNRFGVPDSTKALDQALVVNNTKAVRQLLQAHPTLAERWDGVVFERALGSRKTGETMETHPYLGRRAMEAFLMIHVGFLVEHGWRPSDKGVTWLQKQGDTTPPPALARALIVLDGDRIEASRLRELLSIVMTPPPANARGFFMPNRLSTFASFMPWWEILPESLRSRCRTEDILEGMAHQWEAGEANMFDGWWVLEKMRDTIDMDPSSTKSPAIPRRRL
jgi:hypothetical protein